MANWLKHFLNLRHHFLALPSVLAMGQNWQTWGTRKGDHHQDFLEIYVESRETMSGRGKVFWGNGLEM